MKSRLEILKSRDGWRLTMLAALVASVIASGCNREREQLPPSTSANAADSSVKVTVQPITFRRVQRRVGVVGTLHGYEEISLGAKVQGRVKKITHDVSDRVKPGETLLEVEPTDYQLSLRQAQRALQVEVAKLGLADLPTANSDLTHIPTVVQAQLRRDNAEKRLDRSKMLVAKKASPEEELTEKMSEFRVAQAEYDNQVLVARAGIANIQVKQEALAIARQQLQDTLIRVPEPSQPVPGLEKGVTYAVTARPVSEGSYVMPGTEVFKIVIEQPLKFRGRVPERRSGEVRLGQKAEVFTAAFERAFPGEVTRINPSIDTQTRAFEVEILVPNTQGDLNPGGFAKTAILTGIDEHAATVPLEALVRFAGVTKIFLAVDGHAREVQVTLGMQDSNWVEIATPKLPEDGLVVTSGQTVIANGTAVAVREAATPSTQVAEPSGAPARDMPTPPMARKETTP
jgi:RND family efflux transporter MFP subunit